MFFLKDLTILRRKKGRLYIGWMMTLALSLKLLTRVVVVVCDSKNYLKKAYKQLNSKDTNQFLNKSKSIEKLPYAVILCTDDIAGLYPNTLHSEVWFFFKDFWNCGITNKSDTKWQSQENTLLVFILTFCIVKFEFFSKIFGIEG